MKRAAFQAVWRALHATSEQAFTGRLIQTDGRIVAIDRLDGDLAVARYLAN